MRYNLLLAIFLISFSAARGQDAGVQIHGSAVHIDARLIGKDSVVIPFNEHYVVVQPSCTQIIRYGHMKVFKSKTFYGKFRDVNASDTTKTIAEGFYTKDGLKNGPFISYFLNGKLQAKGTYINNKYDGDWVFYYSNGNLQAKGHFDNGQYTGKWEQYYENGQPELFFEVNNGVSKILNAWSSDGVKTVVDGNSEYQASPVDPHWLGRFRNGRPDSVWDYHQELAGMKAFATETFVDGKFFDGRAGSGSFVNDYSDASHIVLVPNLPYLEIHHSDYLDISNSCGGRDTDADIYMFGKVIKVATFTISGTHSN